MTLFKKTVCNGGENEEILGSPGWIQMSGLLLLVTKSCPTVLWPSGLQPPQAPLSMGFLREEYCSGLQFSSSGDLPISGIEPGVFCIGRWILFFCKLINLF